MISTVNNYLPRLLLLAASLLPAVLLPISAYAEQGSSSSDMQVIQAFNEKHVEEGEAVRISDKRKHVILFLMGVTLLVFLLATAVLGVVMGIYGKQLFVPHMLLAGFSVTLAIAHSIAAIVWFFPF